MHTLTPICPKCGYDQTGEIATWKTNCPVQGTCSECGLEFDWLIIFEPTRLRLAWYAEHARSLAQLIQRTPSTIARLVLPSKFWKRVHPAAHVNLKALVLWFVLLATTTHLMVCTYNAVKYYLRIKANNGWDWNRFTTNGFYSYTELAFNSVFRGIFGMYTPTDPNGITHVSIHWISWTSFSNTYLRSTAASLGINLMWLLVLLVIPTTRRLAQIRTAHVVRAFVLSSLGTLLALELSLLLMRPGSYYWYMRYEYLDRSLSSTLIALWQLVFWPSAIIWGWKIKSPKLLILLGTAAAILAGSLLEVWVYIIPDF